MDALELIRKTYEEIDPDEEGPDEQGCASSSSPTMEASQPSQLHSVGHSLPIDAIESIREMYQKIDPRDQIDPLLCLVETWLYRMKTPSEAGSSSSEGFLETVREGTKLAAEKTIHTISTEAEKLSISDAVEEMGNLVLEIVKGIEELHLVFLGLSIAAFALESYMSVRPVDNECRELLLKILELAINVKHYREQMHDKGKLCTAVGTIVECGVICCDCLTRGATCRFWSTTTEAAQLEKANKQLMDVRDSIQLIKDYRGDKDVFLSHSGKQKNFVRQLYRDLTREHVSCFFDEDDKSLPPAEKFPPLIFKHAETCKIAVLVLSKDFIFSKWPMLELSAFIRANKSGKNISLLPIFFMISPEELKITKDDPKWQELKVSDDDRGEWEAALKAVRSIKGLCFAENGDEVKFREEVGDKIHSILERIKLESRPHLLDIEPVGIDEERKEVTELLNLTEPSRRVVVNYGVGGIGKTTLATAVFESLDLRGYHYCRVDMDQDCRLSDLQAMQERILRDLFKEDLKLSNCTHGRVKLGEAFGKASKPVFLFIDNALKQTDLEKLLPINHISGLPVRSRILVTTRNLKETNVFSLRGIQFCSHRIDSVLRPKAKRILCHYAGLDMNGNFDGGVDMDGLLQICGGIPLLLKIVGSHLRTKLLDGEGNVLSAYNDTLQYFKEWQQAKFEGGEEDVSESMVGFVYERLKEPCKQAFLDIALFFYDWARSEVAHIVGEDHLHDLELAALVTTSEEDMWELGRYRKVRKTVVKMHDIVRARGKKLSQGTRITNIESLSVLLSDAQKLQEIKGIWLRNNDEKFSLEEKDVDLMSTSLRVLCLGRRIRLNGRCNKSFGELRFLDISYKDVLPLDLRKASRLIFFQGHLIKGSHTRPFTLNLPDSLLLLRLDGQEDFPVSINGHFTSVIELRLSHITFENFETNIRSGNFRCLKILDMSDCSMVERLPESFGNLSCLQTLRMRGCSMVERLPQSFNQLSCLQTLEIHGCERICILSDNFGQLKCLKFLKISNCEELKRLPEDIIHLTSLAAIKAIGCASLEAKAMDSFLEIRSLMFLDIDESPMLIKRWEEIQHHPPLIGRLPLRLTCLYESYGEIESAMLFSGGSRFLHVDGDGPLAEMASSWFPDVGVKVCLFFTACDILSHEVKEKLVEVASKEFQIMYVDVGMEGEVKGEREKRIRKVLEQLPEGSRAWTCRFYKTNLLFAYPLWRSTWGVNTSILGTSVEVDEQGRKKLSKPFEKLFHGDNCDTPRVELRTLFNRLSEAYSWMNSATNTVVKMVDMPCCEKCMRVAMKCVMQLCEIDSIQFNMRNNNITVIGAEDPLCIVRQLRRKFCCEILSVGPRYNFYMKLFPDY